MSGFLYFWCGVRQGDSMTLNPETGTLVICSPEMEGLMDSM